MPKTIFYVARQLKIKIKWTLATCRLAWRQCKKERGKAVYQSIHSIFVIVTTVSALPYRVMKLENGYRQFLPVTGLRKWLIKGMYAYMVLQPGWVALLPASPKLKLTVAGNFTADWLIWVHSIMFTAVPAIFGYNFLRNTKDVELVHNRLEQIMRSATRKYFHGKHIFELVDIHWAVVLVLAWTGVTAVLIPIGSIATFFCVRDTPAIPSYHILGTYSDIEDHDIIRIVVYWILSLVECLYWMYLAWAMITLMILMGDGFIGLTILLKKIRSLSPKEISWREKYRLHAQLEIILTVYNNWVGFACPLLILAGVLFSVCSIIILMKVDLEMRFPSPPLIPFFLMFGAGGAIGGATIIKYAEELRANSIGYLQEVEATITACSLLELRRKMRIDFYPTGRTFRRRPIGVRIGSFMYMEQGLSSAYLMQIQDKTINYFFMVDLKSHPIWLWGKF